MKKVLTYLLPLLLGIALLPVPLLRDFHFESALIAATIGCFWGGISSSHWLTKRDFQLALRIFRAIYLFGLPLFIYSSLSGCLTIDGIGFWILVPIPSVFFGISIGRFFRKLYVPFARAFTVLTLLFVAVGVLLFEVLTLPQVYFFNHVWGAWPGPIYDEAVQVTSSLVWFRVLTFFWICFFWVLPEWNKSVVTKTLAVTVTLVIGLSYFWLPDFGIVTPRSYLKDQFGHHQTEHFEIYYDDEFFTDQEIEYWGKRHEFHFRQLADTLKIEWPDGRKIESFLYANAWQKKELVGAKFTSYVPVWLKQDQLHIAKQHLEGVLKHELVHVISKQFGNELFNASWSIGLIEGVAEALAADASSESTLDQILAADPPYPTTEQMQNSLSLSGFYSSASSISYTTAGSFIGYLLREYPVECLKEAYPNSEFELAYGVPFDSLVAGWQRTLPVQEIDSVDQGVSEQIFSQRSIFQRFCPHAITPTLRLWDEYQYFQANNRDEEASSPVSELHQMHPENLIIKREWVYNQFKTENYTDVISAIDAQDTTITFSLFRADAFALNNEWEVAFELLSVLEPELNTVTESAYKYSYTLRSDSLQWVTFLNYRYRNTLPNSVDFESLSPPNKVLSQSRANELNDDRLFTEFANQLIQGSLSAEWFDIYESTIDRLVFLGKFDLAQQWIEKVSELQLRARYKERLEQQREWFKFVQELTIES